MKHSTFYGIIKPNILMIHWQWMHTSFRWFFPKFLLFSRKKNPIFWTKPCIELPFIWQYSIVMQNECFKIWFNNIWCHFDSTVSLWSFFFIITFYVPDGFITHSISSIDPFKSLVRFDQLWFENSFVLYKKKKKPIKSKQCPNGFWLATIPFSCTLNLHLKCVHGKKTTIIWFSWMHD